MEKKTVHDLRAHLSLFQPGYPILKGYVARLLSHDLPVSDVIAEVIAIVQAAVPDKQCSKGSIIRNVYSLKQFMKLERNLTQQWSSLTELFLQPFPVTFKSLPVSAAASQPGHTSPAQHPEPVAVSQHPEPMAVSHPEPVPVPQRSEPMPIPQHPEPVSVTPLEPDTQQTTLTQSSAPLSVIPLSPDLIMEKKTVHDLRAHLSVFQPGYPILKGYVAKLLSHDLPVCDVVAGVIAILQAAVPEKQYTEVSIKNNVYALKRLLKDEKKLTRHWSSLTELFLQPFSIPLKRFPVSAVTCQPGHTSPAQHPEPVPVPQYPEPMPVPQHPEPMPVIQHHEPMPVPHHPEPMPVIQQPEPVLVTQHPEPVPVPQHPEPVPVPQHHGPLSVTPSEPDTQQTTLTQSSAPLSVTPLEPDMIMEKTVHDLNAHLSLFQPGYPILKGYIARLLSHDLPVNDVVAEVLAIVQAAVPDKQCNVGNIKSNVYALKQFMKLERNLTQKWSSLTEYFLKPFPVTLKCRPVSATASQPGYTSPAQHPEPVPVLQHPEPVPVPQHPEPMPVLQHPEPMPVPQHPEPMPVPQHPEPMPVPQHYELMVVPQHHEPMAVPQHPKPVPVPQHPEPVPVPLSATPLELDLIMEKRVRDLREHLSVFQPGYPILKGYVARLLSHNLPVSDVIAEVIAIVQAAVPEKKCKKGSIKTNVYLLKRLLKDAKNLAQQWSSLTEVFLEQFPIKFMKSLVAPASSRPERTSRPRYPEPPTSPTSEMLPQPVTSALMQPVQNSITINSSSFSTTSELPSTKKHKRNCANCITKQLTNMNLLLNNKRLHQELKEFKMHFTEENGQFSMKRFNEKIKRKDEQITKWKLKYTSLKEACKDTHKLLKCVESLEQQVKTLEVKLIASQEQNINTTAANVWFKSRLEKTKIDYDNVKQESIELKRMLEETENAKTHFEQVHEQLKDILEKAENNDTHFKQLHGQLKSLLETTEKDDACLNWHRQASDSPEMEIIEEIPCEAADNYGDNFTFQDDEILQEDLSEVPFENIIIEDVIQAVTDEEKIEPPD